MISANGGLPAHRYTPQVTQRWPRGSEPASTQLFYLVVVVLLFNGFSIQLLGQAGQATSCVWPNVHAADS